MENRHFTTEELERAKSTDLCEVAAKLGYTVRRVGQFHTLKEMDSIRIYHRTSWFRWSRQYETEGRGGSQIDFLKTFAGMGTREAIFWLLEFAGERRENLTRWEYRQNLPHKTKAQESKTAFVLPVSAPDNRRLYAYLTKERKLSKEVIDAVVSAGLIYESLPYHNIVFKGNDKTGVTRFASLRGTMDREGKGFRCDVAGSDKRYGFHWYRKGSHQVVVLEAAIDAMSYLDLFQDWESSLLALGMLSDVPLATFLQDYPEIRQIRLCLDRDGPGRKATKALLEKYTRLGYEMEDCPPPLPYKDYNERLQEERRKTEKTSKNRRRGQETGRKR